jgi:RNA polymerase sigma-70 factor (ECF subfamily)
MVHLDHVFRYAFARLRHREDAEDIAIEVVQSLPNPCHRQDLRIYMIGMARRKVADRLRKPRMPLEPHDHEASVRFDGRADDAAMVSATLAVLSDDHREVLVMKYIVGLTSSEIGAITGKNAAAVDSTLQRARDAFSKHWKTQLDEVLG